MRQENYNLFTYRTHNESERNEIEALVLKGWIYDDVARHLYRNLTRREAGIYLDVARHLYRKLTRFLHRKFGGVGKKV